MADISTQEMRKNVPVHVCAAYSMDQRQVRPGESISGAKALAASV